MKKEENIRKKNTQTSQLHQNLFTESFQENKDWEKIVESEKDEYR